MEPCPCGTELSYQECCGPFHQKTARPPTAEALMRSRYCAYVKGEIDYLFKTLLPEKRTFQDIRGAREWSESAEWLGLEIINARGGQSDKEGRVEFVARYRQAGIEQAHHEVSTFKKRADVWYFFDGKTVPAEGSPAAAAVSRSAPCPCGSGKKFKRCCGA